MMCLKLDNLCIIMYKLYKIILENKVRWIQESRKALPYRRQRRSAEKQQKGDRCEELPNFALRIRKTHARRNGRMEQMVRVDLRQAGRQGASPWWTRNLALGDQGPSVWERLHHRLYYHQSRKP